MKNYLIEFSMIHLVLMLGYWFLLKGESQYSIRRFYLLASTFLALSIPLLILPKIFQNQPVPVVQLPMEVNYLDPTTISQVADTPIWTDLFTWIYFGISFYFLMRFLIGILYLIQLEHKSICEKYQDFYIRKAPNIDGSFTFFNWIFVSKDLEKNLQDYPVIIKHEKAHAILRHTYDLLFFELFKVCSWWLPSAWFINREIKVVHEYQADSYALKSCGTDEYSSVLINNALKSNGLKLTCSFHDGLILKRLRAMKQKTKKISFWKLGILSTLSTLLIIIFACSEDQGGGTSTMMAEKSNTNDQIFSVVESLPEFKGGMNAFYSYVRKEIRYPLEARLGHVEGRVDVQFVVDKDGSLSDVKAIRGIGSACDQEAVRVVQNAPAFIPGRQRGKPVRVRMEMPIIFKLDRGKTNPDNSTQGMIIVEEIESKNQILKVDANYDKGVWSGVVYDEHGGQLPGANIVVVGTTNGTVSDLDGSFEVKADAGKELHISFVGYQGVRLKAKR